jgi:hypothetical protein
LSDFRTAQGAFLDQLLTDTIATLLHQELITLETVAQDGMRVRASAGSGSFRRKPTLEDCRREAAQQVQKLREESAQEAANDQSNQRQQAAQERAARERLERVEAALKNLEELAAQKEKREKGAGQQARCSTTDPQARNMKMGDGGFRPAYNVQFASDGDTRMIVSVEVSPNGSDGGQMSPRHADVVQRYGKTPKHYVVDGGFVTIDDVTKVEQAQTQVIGPMPHAERIEQRGGDPYERRPHDTEEMAAFRQRMKTEEAQALLKQRPSIAEFPNAFCRNCGLSQFRVRGLAKVKTVSLWYAIAFNFLRMLQLEIIS